MIDGRQTLPIDTAQCIIIDVCLRNWIREADAMIKNLFIVIVLSRQPTGGRVLKRRRH